MAAKKINLKGTPGQEYNLDELRTTDSRISGTALVVQIWHWCPDLPSSNPHSKPNPDQLVLGQMWLSKLVSLAEATEMGLGAADGN